MKNMKKFMLLGIVLFLFVMMFCSITAEGAKKERMLQVRQGDCEIIKGKKAKKVLLSNNKVALAEIDNGNVRITGIKPGKVSIIIKGEISYKVKVKVIPYKKLPEVFVVKPSQEELRIAEEIKGASSSCRSFSDFPSLKNYSSVKEFQKKVLEKEFEFMPSYIRDALCSWNVSIEFVTSFATKNQTGEASSDGKIKLLIAENKEDLIVGSLIHEGSHIWQYYCQNHGYDPVANQELRELYKKSPDLYGSYGSQTIGEFYAVGMETSAAMQIQQYSDKELETLYLDRNKIRVCKVRKNHVILKLKITDGALLKNAFFYKNEYYSNGKTLNEFYGQREIALMKHYRSLYKKKGQIVDRIDLIYVDRSW